MAYLKITLVSDINQADAFAEAFSELEALSVSLTDHADQPLFQLQPEEQPLWQEVSVSALFQSETSPREVMQRLKQQLNIVTPLNYKIEKVADEDWVRLTQSYFQPQQYGSLWIKPAWSEEVLPGQVVTIEPGLAFGTGTHPTTALCLEYLAKHPPVEQPVIDYGCGSGILALSALCLGARQVYATDHDPQAIEATQNNAALNTFVTAENFHVVLPQAMPVVTAPLVIANILANPLIRLAPTLTALCQKHLVLSGLLVSEIETVYNAYQSDFVLLESHTKDEWALLFLGLRQ